jgi:hypothetical protein
LSGVWQTTKLRATIIASFLLVAFVIICVGIPWVCWPLWKRREKRPWLIYFTLTCVYVIGLTSPVAGYDRCRLPIEGILWICFAALVIESGRKLSFVRQAETYRPSNGAHESAAK